MADRESEEEGISFNKLADFLKLNDEKRERFHDKIARALLFYKIAISNRPSDDTRKNTTDVKSKKTKVLKRKRTPSEVAERKRAAAPMPSEVAKEFSDIATSLIGLRDSLNQLSEPAQEVLRHLGFMQRKRSMNRKHPLNEIVTLGENLERVLNAIELGTKICKSEISVGRPSGSPEEDFLLRLIDAWTECTEEKLSSRDTIPNPITDEYDGPCHKFLVKAAEMFDLHSSSHNLAYVIGKRLKRLIKIEK